MAAPIPIPERSTSHFTVIGSAPVRVIRRSDALRNGLNADEVQRRRQKEWVTLRPGVYLEASKATTLGPVQRHLMLIGATMPVVGEDLVVSHWSAACIWGFDLWQANLTAVQATRPGASSGHRRRSLHTYRAALDDDEVSWARGRRVTTPARTVVDLARMHPFEHAVVAADSALRAGLTDLAALDVAVNRAPRRRGIRRAHEVVAFADARSGSVGESRSRVMLFREGLPAPTPQFPIRTANGAAFARSDFGWAEFRTVGEFDGAQKYGRLLRPGESSGDRIYQEKLREDRIRDTGYQVVRWTWDELQRPSVVVERLLRAFDRGRR